MANVVKRLFYRGASTGGGLSKYNYLFNNAGSWFLNGTNYEITILQSVHGKGTSPIVEVYEATGAGYEEVEVSVSYNIFGDVTITVSATPNNRFTGKLIII